MTLDLPERALLSIKMFVCELRRRGVDVERVYLHGSYARGDWLTSSDVDIIIVSRSVEKIPFKDRVELCWRVVYELGLDPPVEALMYTPSELREELSRCGLLRSISRYWIDVTEMVRDC